MMLNVNMKNKLSGINLMQFVARGAVKRIQTILLLFVLVFLFFNESHAEEGLGEGDECDGCTPGDIGNTSSDSEWYLGETLSWDATIGDWKSANDALKLKSAGYYLSSLIKSDTLFRQMVYDGSFLVHSRRTMSCTNEMIDFVLNTGQDSLRGKLNPIARVCGALVD